MPWYFPTYSAVVIPAILLLDTINISPTYAFALTNVIMFILMLFLIYRRLNVSLEKRLLLIMLLSINPIVFYFVWISAEVMIFTMICLSLLYWYNKNYNLSAIFISIAGTLNPTVMIVGFGIIISFFIDLYMQKRNIKLINYVKSKIKSIFTFLLCFTISLIPMIYNYYHTGHINLTASYEGFLKSQESVLERFVAYLFDLNFGILPYMSIVLIISFIFFIFAIYRKKWMYILMMLVFFGTIFAYSFMIHINSGMSGIARYNAWVTPIMIFAVTCYYDQFMKENYLKIFHAVIVCSVLITSIVLVQYVINPTWRNYVFMNPIAKVVLDKLPILYNPLHSTFYSRVAHVDGGHLYDTPIIYSNDDGYVTKILASKKDKEKLLSTCKIVEGKNQIFLNKVNNLTDHKEYITLNPIFVKVQCNTLMNIN